MKALGVRSGVHNGVPPTPSAQLFERAHIVIATPRQWDAISRRWKKRRAIAETALFIADDLESIGDEFAADGGGATYEVVCSRMRFSARQLQDAAAAAGDGAARKTIRIVALSMCIANARDLADWLGAGPSSTFAFHPQVRCPFDDEEGRPRRLRLPHAQRAPPLSRPAGAPRAGRAAAAGL